MDLMSRKGEQVRFKFFAMQINFQISCSRGKEDHLKASLPPPPHLPCSTANIHSLGWRTENIDSLRENEI